MRPLPEPWHKRHPKVDQTLAFIACLTLIALFVAWVVLMVWNG